MKKLYSVKITFDPKDYKGEVQNVGLVGEFLFYNSRLTGHTEKTGMAEGKEKYVPSLYQEGMSNIGGFYYREMSYEEENGLYETDLKLPAGVYPYGFVVNGTVTEPASEPTMSWSNFMMDDGKWHNILREDESVPYERIVDPKNPPFDLIKTAEQMNSMLYVGTAEECLRIPPDEAFRGTLSYMSYKDIENNDRALGVYMPAGYDSSKTYPVVYVTHGGGGTEVDWFSQGGLAYIMDNLIAAGKTREAIVVTMNNSVYQWNYELIYKNLATCVIPFIGKLFHISESINDHAFCGLSMGSMTTLYIYMHYPQYFRYFGAFSGGLAGGEDFTLENPLLKERVLMIGCAEEDIAYNQREIGVPPTLRQLEKADIPHIPYFVTGSHDWFCWPAMFEYFAESVLWK